jgi:purine-binding chemotaxis protein CheW
MQESSAGARTFLAVTFRLGEAAFGIDAGGVQEVIRSGNITPVHGSPDFIVGVLNLRGRIVTVIDLGRKMDLPAGEPTANSRVIIVDWKGEHVGLLVSEVADVVSVDRDGVSPPPANAKVADRKYLSGAFKAGDRVIALLDAGAVLEVQDKQAAAS